MSFHATQYWAIYKYNSCSVRAIDSNLVSDLDEYQRRADVEKGCYHCPPVCGDAGAGIFLGQAIVDRLGEMLLMIARRLGLLDGDTPDYSLTDVKDEFGKASLPFDLDAVLRQEDPILYP